MSNYSLTHLEELEAEAIYVIREVYAQFDNPAILFSGGKDSIVVTHLARKAFWPAKIPFPLVHIDTGHNFPETMEFRDNLIKEMGANLVVGSVQQSIDEGAVVEETGMNASRNALQTTTLLDTIEFNNFDACMGGARRDEEKARAKERFFSHRDDFGQWDPKNQRPELWNLFNGKKRMGEHFRVFPISNWTEMDVWQYILKENIAIPELYFAKERNVIWRNGSWLPVSEFITLKDTDEPQMKMVRFRTLGDITITGGQESDADTLEKIIQEVASSRQTERGNREDDKRSERLLLTIKVKETMENNFDTQGYLDMELLRFTTAGSVDDGKSTLIGRLLYDSKSIFEDQVQQIEQTSKKKGLEHVDLSLFTDGLKDEREQGITIDVAYRYFATPKRKFIIADTPGHVQYTRNMVTGASTANLALILVDARNGVIEQTKRHTFIASLLQIPHIFVCINKMDLVDYSQEAYDKVVKEYTDFAAKLNVKDVRFVPMSALHGDNVVSRGENMSWYEGGTLLHNLETVHISSDHNLRDCRFPVQTVIRPHSDEYHDFRGYAGRVAGGVFKKGVNVVALPSGLESKISAIHTMTGELDEAFPPQSVTITLEDDIDISRGDVLVRSENRPEGQQDLDVMLCWLNANPPRPRAKYVIKHTTAEARAMITDIQYKMDINTLHRIEEDKAIKMNDIARVKIRSTKPLFADDYTVNRVTGSIILVDEATNETVAAGMVR
jgi:sulfate adenylyltransferase subunit 1